MNAARGTEKVDALAAVVNELVAQRTQMRDRMTAMQDRMMGHMMSMQGGMMGMANRGQTREPPSIQNCPLMKGLLQEGARGPSGRGPTER